MSLTHKPAKSLLLVGLIAGVSLISACQTSPFAREPVAEPRYVPNVILGEVQTLNVLPERVACASALPMQCLLVKSGQDGSLFQIPYDWIDNFKPVLGVEYTISARPQIDESKQSPTGYWTLQSILTQR